MRYLLFTVFLISSLFAEQITYVHVQKVKSNDVLNIRAKPTHKSDQVSSIPFNAQCLKNHGCGKDISFEAMMQMEEDEIKHSLYQATASWCYLEYEGKFGWVNRYYLDFSKVKCD